MTEKECGYGKSITEHYAMIASLAKIEKEKYYFEANGIIFIADKDSDPKLAEKFLDFCYQYDIKVCGPQEPMITEEYKAMKDKESEERKKAYEEEARIKREQEQKDKAEVEAITKDETLHLVRGEDYMKWKANQKDGYGMVCFEYAEDLMKLLQHTYRLKGAPLVKEDVNRAEHKIRYHNISGFQHSVVVSILRMHWDMFNEGLF